MTTDLTAERNKLKSVYADLRKYRRKGTDRLAVEWYYNNHPEISEQYSLFGFAKIMSVMHVFWSSRGEETRKDLEREDNEGLYIYVDD